MWSSSHKDKSIPAGNQCNNCDSASHFARVWEKTDSLTPVLKKRAIKKSVKAVEHKTTAEKSVKCFESENLNKLYESEKSRSRFNMLAGFNETAEKTEPLNMPLTIFKIAAIMLVDSGSACRVLKKKNGKSYNFESKRSV